MGVQSEKAAMISGPILRRLDLTSPNLQADATGMTNVMRIAVTTGSLSFAFPVITQNSQKSIAQGKRFLWLAATDAVAGTNCNPQWVQYEGPTAPTLVYNQLSVSGVGSVAAGRTLFSGLPDQVEIDPRATGIAFIGIAAGFLEWHVSDSVGRP